MANAIADWLLACSADEIFIAFDYSTDWELLVETLRKVDASRCEQALGKLRPVNVDALASTAVAQIAIEEFWEERRVCIPQLNEHQALADARALWAALNALAQYRS